MVMLKVMRQALPQVFGNAMLLPEVGGDLRASGREGKAALWPTADQETYVWVGI
jgi:hypothetical protein